jgi:hypothetical protein
VSDGRYIYILGGYDSSVDPTASLWRYDPDLNIYQPLMPYTQPTTNQGAVVRNGKIYRIGGFVNGFTINTVEVYTINSNTWTAGPVYPLSIAHVNTFSYGRYFYTAGGFTQTDSVNQSKTYRFDPATSTWDDAAIADLPEARGGSVGGLLNGRWVLAGGGNDSFHKAAVAWNPVSNTWSSLPVMPQGSTHSGGGVMNQALLVSAGFGSTGHAHSVSQAYTEAICDPFVPTPSPTPGGPTPTACPLQFTDVPEGSTFYDFVRCLACRGIVSGYGDGTFGPGNNVTRGQIAKIVSNAANFTNTPNTTTFADISSSHTFYEFIERLAVRGIIGGYACGGAGEPCVPPANKPYFRASNNASRGQLSKIVCQAFGCEGAPSGQTFEDVPPGSTFYTEIEQLYALGAIGGYACGGLGEPCVPPDNRPYFRPGATVTRGQTAKIVSSVFFPNCQTP